MDVYLAGIGTLKNEFVNGKLDASTFKGLESFFSVKDWEIPYIAKMQCFMLDSGAYSFVQSGHGHGNVWEEYVDRYAAFVKQHRVKLYFELDIDSIVGLPKVEELRKRLEVQTGTLPIPVWHLNRGKEYFERMCRNYPYVAIGGLVGKKAAINFEAYFPWFINTAHKHGAKIHGLGFTKTKLLTRYRFDSVDSTTWTAGQRFGEIHMFNGQYVERKIRAIEGNRRIYHMRDAKALSWHNLNEWLKFQRYADKHL